jgi:hypothetical protein
MPYPNAIKNYPNGLQKVIKSLYSRIFVKNKNALIVIVGQTGSAKSYSGLGFLVPWYLYIYGIPKPDEEIIKHVKFRAVDFMKEMEQKDLPIGDGWMWDEAGVDAGNQDYQSLKNKVISWYAQTCRSQRQLVIFTLPAMSMLTSQVRKLLHFYFETNGIDYKNEISFIKPFQMQYNTRMDKIYYHKFSYTTKEEFIEVIDEIGIPLIHESLKKLYEDKKEEFRVDLNKEIYTILKVIDKDKNTMLEKPEEIKKMIKDAIKKYNCTTLKDCAKYLGMANANSFSRYGGFTLFVKAKEELEQEKKLQDMKDEVKS